MACVIVTSLVRTLELEFLQSQLRPIVQENELINGNKELIESLHEKLEFFMEHFDEKRMKGVEAIKQLESKLRDVASRVEDEIEFQVIDLYMEKPQRGADEEKTPPCLRLHHCLQNAIQDVDQIREEFVKVKNEYDHVIDLQGRKTMFDVLPISSCQLASHYEDIMVGKNNEFQTIKEMLIEHPSREREVVSIKGMGGIGKTTLARRIFEDPSIVSHFDKLAWVVASQYPNKTQMLIDLLNSMGSANSGNDEELALQLYQDLKRQRYLIVIDDIWSGEAWDAVKTCFPDDGLGSRVLLTTRLEDVAKYAHSNSEFSHQMHLLDQSESWNLFYNKACKSCEVDFEAIGRPVVERCKGLPLAIVVVAGLFSKLNTQDEWEKIAKTLISSVSTTIDEECSRILSLSYHHLPFNLKACFLYLGVFPEDEEINAGDLEKLWLAEGLVKTSESESSDTRAKRYIQELVDRNLIHVSQRSSCGRKVKAFMMHDLLHAFCVREVQNKGLLQIINKNSSQVIQKGFRWVSIQSSTFDPQMLHFPSGSYRSLFFFRSHLEHRKFEDFNMLRVLYSPQSLDVRIKHPIHLRYLSSFIEYLNCSKPHKSWNLQTINSPARYFPLRFLSFPMYIFPFLDFPHLCYFTSCGFSHLRPPKFVQQNLQSISGLSLSQCTKLKRELFTKIPYVKKVGIIIKDDETIFNCIAGIMNLGNLQQLERLHVDVYEEYEMPTPTLEYPILYKIVHLRSLKKLSFMGTLFLWEDINVLSMLPSLEVLKLEYEACKGHIWELREEMIFCQLIFLKIRGHIDIRNWKVSEDHFPKLERLLIYDCENLKEIPSNFGDISTLKSIELRKCLPSVVTSAKQIQEEQYDQGNYDMVLIEKDTLLIHNAIEAEEEDHGKEEHTDVEDDEEEHTDVEDDEEEHEEQIKVATSWRCSPSFVTLVKKICQRKKIKANIK